MKLLLLRCPVCQEPLKPADRDIVLPCANCHEAIRLDDQTGISQATVRYAVPLNPNQVTDWLPVWVSHGRVNITTRKTQGVNQKALKASQAMWSQPRTLYAPAWELPIPQARKIGSGLTESQPMWVEGARPSNQLFKAANVASADVRNLIELIILTIEAERKDWLEDLAFTLEVPPPELWIVPAENGRRGLKFLTQAKL